MDLCDLPCNGNGRAFDSSDIYEVALSRSLKGYPSGDGVIRRKTEFRAWRPFDHEKDNCSGFCHGNGSMFI